MERILIPIDFSEESKHALDLSYQIARKAKATMILIHIIEHPTSQTFSASGGSLPDDMSTNVYILQLIKKVKSDMAEIINDSQYSDIDIVTDIKIGNPYKGIAETIAEKKVAMVVMGSKGSGGMAEMLIGSNAEKVVRYAKCPVITVKKKVNITDIGEIIFANNFVEDNDHIIGELKKLQRVFIGKLHLLVVNTPNNFKRDKENKALIEAFIKKYDIENYTINIYNDLTEEEGILNFAGEIGADMIAMATHGRTGLMHLISGSIAEDVVNHAKRPVWTYNIEE